MPPCLAEAELPYVTTGGALNEVDADRQWTTDRRFVDALNRNSIAGFDVREHCVKFGGRRLIRREALPLLAAALEERARRLARGVGAVA